MLAVRPADRGSRVGESLKRAQYRARARGASVELIEWTFDPLQAQNAHLNLSVLACTASEYRENAYGELSGPLHHGTPTDRLVAEWWIRREQLPSPDATRAPLTIPMRKEGAWLVCDRPRTDFADAYVLVPVPPSFSDMQRQATEVALAWRLATREVFSAYFARGYRAVGFLLRSDDAAAARAAALGKSDFRSFEASSLRISRIPGGHASERPPSTCR